MKNDNVRKSQVTNKTKNGDKKSVRGKSSTKNEVKKPSSSNSKRSKQSRGQRSEKAQDDEVVELAQSPVAPVEEPVPAESREGSQLNLLQDNGDLEEEVKAPEEAPVEVPAQEENVPEEENQDIDKQIEDIEIPSIQGSVDQAQQDGAPSIDDKAVTEKGAKQSELIDGGEAQADQFTNHKRLNDDGQNLEILSEGQEAINVAPGLDEEADKDEIEMVGFDDDDFGKPTHQEADVADGDFYDDHHSGGSNGFLELEQFEAESVRALTLKDGVNYDDDRFDDAKLIQHQYGAGFEPEDDLDGDGVIDPVEKAIKINDIQEHIQDELQDKIQEDYLKKFRKEVDFHHKVAYRFEKAYRLGKKMTLKKQALNNEITSIIEEHAQYLEQDPMALFYCLYFCIYYNNPELVEFLKILIDKMGESNKPDKIDEILKLIVENSIDRLRQVGDPLNVHVYHMVFFQAVDDDLRIVYTQILRQLKFIMLRDKDALHLLKQRDYELIRLTFEKHTTKLNILSFFKKPQTLKSITYRQYNQAYFEEILIDFQVDQRVALNYRERFVTNKEEIMLVLEMYCKVDYQHHFLKTDLSEITHSQFVDLFSICVRNDSFKIAMQIYLRYLTSADMSQKIMELVIFSIRDTTIYHEMKIFFIHEHFDVLSIFQMNQLVDIYMEILHRKELKTNPMLSQFNTIKYALLIYRISWKIAQKRIYSLITKCSLLNSYIQKSLESYLLKQQHISQLYKFMSEPILHMTERKDSLDIMLEMNMEGLLKHPVIVEVLNLVYEGKYSVDSSALNLSQTFQCFFLMDTTDLKSINDRLIANIISFGDNNNGKQASLQFNIWKQCIEQREKDEMLFSVIFSIIILILTLIIDEVMSEISLDMEITFGTNFINIQHVFRNAQENELKEFCPHTEKYLFLAEVCEIFFMIIMVSGLGYFTAIIQKFTILRLKDNVELSVSHLCLEISIVAVTVMCILMKFDPQNNNLITDVCSQVMDFTEDQIQQIGFVNSLIAQTNQFSFPLIVSVIVCQYSLIMIVMLQRTEKLGELIMMVNQMISELKKFLITFGLLIGLFIIIGRQLSSELKVNEASFFQIVLDIFDGFNGKQDFAQYNFPQGKIFITIFVFIFNVLLLSFLVAMFINRYKFVWLNLEALRRMNIIKLKNTNSYDQLYGGVTITFFPISIIMLPFVIPVVVFKSERLNDFILKIQYAAMILMYCLLGTIIAVPLVPMLYFKLIVNAVFIQFNNKRQDYKGQNLLNLFLTTFLGPPILLVSLLIDLISLPSLLLIDERNFEYKYQASLEILSAIQVEVILNTFIKIFYINFGERFAGKGMTLIELMQMHRKIFSLIENLHDLCCRGTKDYKEALANVQDYNMTKILTRKCSVPDRSGDIKQNTCDFTILYNCQMDIEIYNYIDTLLHDHRSGKLVDGNVKKKKMTKEEEEEAEKGTGLNAGVVVMAMGSAPSYMTYKRDNADFMNNFFVNIIARSFTDIDEFLKNQEENKDQNKQANTLKELENLKEVWKSSLTQEATEQFAQFDQKIMAGNKSGEYNLNKEKYKPGVIGSQASLGVRVLDKKGKDADIENLIDM